MTTGKSMFIDPHFRLILELVLTECKVAGRIVSFIIIIIISVVFG